MDIVSKGDEGSYRHRPPRLARLFVVKGNFFLAEKRFILDWADTEPSSPVKLTPWLKRFARVPGWTGWEH